jgi:hypothetical protein
LVYKRLIKYFSFSFLFFFVVEIDSEEKEAKLETTDILETVTGSPSEHKAVKEEENKMKVKEEKLETQKVLAQQVENLEILENKVKFSFS